jgi:BASS family bile acid:Na+ symporter
MLPVIGFLLTSVFPLSPALAVGVIVLAACPGGPTSNLLTYLAMGDVALSITLTAISSLITVFTIPLVVNFATRSFMGENVSLQLPFGETVVQIAVITLIPVALGMLIYHYAPQFAGKVEKWVKWLSLFFLALIIFGLLLKERANVLTFFLQVGGVTLTLNLVSMLLGYGFARLAKLSFKSAIAITCEVGIQNGTLAIAIASSPTLLNNPNYGHSSRYLFFADVYHWRSDRALGQTTANRHPPRHSLTYFPTLPLAFSKEACTIVI